MIKNAKSVAARHGKLGAALLRSAAALLALAAFAAAPASARPFQQLVVGNCVVKTCKYDFVKVPIGQRLEIRNVSCYLRMGAAAETFFPPIVASELAVLGATTPPKTLNAVELITRITGAHEDQIVVTSNDSVAAFATAQQHFQVVTVVYDGALFETRCQISGDMVSATS